MWPRSEWLDLLEFGKEPMYRSGLWWLPKIGPARASQVMAAEEEVWFLTGSLPQPSVREKRNDAELAKDLCNCT